MNRSSHTGQGAEAAGSPERPAPGSLLLEAVLRAAGRLPARAAVVGICKNAGKTVALNHLIQAAAARGLGMGLLSSGRDGEEQDAITELPKPRIQVPAGAWVATAAGALAAATAGLQVVQELPLATPLGPMVAALVTRPGTVVLVGPGSARRAAAVFGALAALAEKARRPIGLFLADGSFDRRAAAAPTVTGTVVLAAGAAYSPSMPQTVAQAAHLLDLFRLPGVPPHWDLHVRAPRAPVQWLAPGGGATALPFSALVQADALAESLAQRPPGGALCLSGAVTDALLQALVLRPALAPRFTLLVRDATRILASRQLWRRFRRQGGQAAVADPVQVAAVAANPCSPGRPGGGGYDPAAFVGALAAVSGGLPVIDLEGGVIALGQDTEARD